MTSVVQNQAEQVLAASLETALANGRIREKTRSGMRKVSEACRRIVERKDELTIANVVRVMSELYPGDHPAEQSVRNSSLSGDAYKQVIAAWKTHAEAVGRAKKVEIPSVGSEDFPDTLLNVVEPRSARLLIVSMRTALRNMRRQFQMLQSITPEKLIRHEVTSETPVLPAIERAREFSEAEREAIAMFLDPIEMGARGFNWDSVGRLCTESGEVVSRPGLRSALEKAAKG